MQLQRVGDLDATLSQLQDVVAGLPGQLGRGRGGFTQIESAAGDMQRGMADVQRTATELSGRLDPLRNFVAGTPDCQGNMLCAAVDQVVAPVDELLRGMVVHNANDATVALAEGLAGSVEAFVERMNRQAEVFGLHKSTIQRVVNGRVDGDRVEPLFGSGEWTPGVQDQDPHTCDRCGGDAGVIQRGSKLYCAACHRTGIERRLAEQRTVTEIADQYAEVETEYHAAAQRKNLAQRRKIKRA